jgi:DNA topoisomerase-1
VVARCQELPGQELFQYADADGARQTVDSADVNAYLRDVSGKEFTAKDFRTWVGTVLAAQALSEISVCESKAQARRNVVRAIESVARQLGNTPAICRKSYVHPAVVDAYFNGRVISVADASPNGLRPEETAVLALLGHRSPEPAARRAA